MKSSNYGDSYPSNDDSGAPKTIPEFCMYHKIGKSTYYQLAKRKLAPKTMRIGRAVRISAAAEQEWIARMEAGEAAHVPEFASKPPRSGDKGRDTGKRQKKRRSKERSRLSAPEPSSLENSSDHVTGAAGSDISRWIRV